MKKLVRKIFLHPLRYLAECMCTDLFHQLQILVSRDGRLLPSCELLHGGVVSPQIEIYLYFQFHHQGPCAASRPRSDFAAVKLEAFQKRASDASSSSAQSHKSSRLGQLGQCLQLQKNVGKVFGTSVDYYSAPVRYSRLGIVRPSTSLSLSFFSELLLGRTS